MHPRSSMWRVNTRANKAMGYYPLLGCTRVLNMTTVDIDANKLAHPTFWHNFFFLICAGDIQEETINTLQGQNVMFLDVKSGTIYSCQLFRPQRNSILSWNLVHFPQHKSLDLDEDRSELIHNHVTSWAFENLKTWVNIWACSQQTTIKKPDFNTVTLQGLGQHIIAEASLLYSPWTVDGAPRAVHHAGPVCPSDTPALHYTSSKPPHICWPTTHWKMRREQSPHLLLPGLCHRTQSAHQMTFIGTKWK